MNERDRLAETIRDALELRDLEILTANFNDLIDGIDVKTYIADHLIAHNVAIPPVSVGQTVYIIRRPTERPAWIDECKVDHVRIDYFKDGCKTISFGGYNYGATESYIGKTVFLTREEAVQALKERSEKE